MSNRRRAIWGGIAYVAFLGLFVELALQTFYYVTAGDFLFRRVGLALWESNEHSGFANRRSFELEHGTQEFRASYFNNDEGFRVSGPGVEYARRKPDDVYRVMLLGPSFAYGWGVDYDETFAAYLEARLQASGYGRGKSVQIINAGVPSMPPAPQLVWYQNVGREYEPDLVIQFIYGSMAVSNDSIAHANVTGEGYLVPKQNSLSRRIRARAKKFATVFYAWVVWTKLDSMRSSGEDEDDGAVLGAGRALSSVTDFDTDQPEVADALDFYGKLRSTMAADGTELLLVYFPLSYAIHEEDVSRWKHLGVKDVAAQIAFDESFVQHLNQQGIESLNVTPHLQQAANDGERLYFWLDIHWTAAGNEVTARAVADHLLGANGSATGPRG